MANNVIKFPTEERTRTRLKTQMNELIGNMDELYADIDDCMASLCELEEKVSKVEQIYNGILKSYAQATTTTELEARYLAYCSNAQVHWDGDRHALVFTLPPMPEEDEPA